MYDIAEEALENIIKNGWATTPINYDDVAYNSKKGTSFVRFQVEWADAGSAGPNRTRRDGLVFISIFTPKNEGSRTSATYAGQIEQLYKQSNLTGVDWQIRMFAGTCNRVGDNKNWYQRNLLIPFQFDYCN